MPGDDDERCETAQRLELHEFAVRAHGGGQRTCADQRVRACNVQSLSAFASLVTGCEQTEESDLNVTRHGTSP